MADIDTIAIAPLFGPPSPARDQTDSRIMAAASGIGFMAIRDFPGDDSLTPQNRARLLAIFSLPEAEKEKLLRWNFDHTKQNVYRGWFPLQPTAVSYKEGIDMGPDIAEVRTAPSGLDATDPLCEATPLPPENVLPGWHPAAAGYYKAMETVGNALLRSVARGLGLTETIFDRDFEGGISTLRLIRYPLRDPNSGIDLSGPDFSVMHKGEMRTIIGREHADSGFVTLLAQDGVEGLQAKNLAGEWIDVPPADNTLAVNFGQLLERWTAGRVRATRHRVIAPKQARFSIPFFYEPRVDAEIAPLPLEGAEPFEPFLYGDYLWDAATKFVEMSGVRHLRQPRRAKAS
ncbi:MULTISPECIES: 2OG-Fe(II) oxygenase family protein [unclassified Mesorhizobium]|uniref:isopenicillin N synthase family dioxygenase n=1 Tax=unclassified Mesorhizobium TaxID=325217 RepID=UPI000FD960B9|nr:MULTISPECIES: 2OG-Fe(II) oxygenase family protein [unclassified Mesorhizobium]TGQ17621.1 isopenicillin N synthase family oxygenase [Mesorhizobium sp. M2E.F.Ca.ET.219.01.1.1]TGT76222.1 isopenicillin N synthase family oxygenase [Mesorhizobium sp. M2E.F.Ca.ET.166.01.1.1]TGW02337.1 isopenicillin N synthase family oxygenase [Mesorhizobium sp. M2E.F.Ca.ET.154.01.1.1]